MQKHIFIILILISLFSGIAYAVVPVVNLDNLQPLSWYIIINDSLTNVNNSQYWDGHAYSPLVSQWTNDANYAVSGTCPAGEVVQNTTTSGVQCIAASTGGGAGNPFDQSLNTTDDVMFNTMNASSIKTSSITNIDDISAVEFPDGALINTGSYLSLGDSANVNMYYDGTEAVFTTSGTGFNFTYSNLTTTGNMSASYFIGDGSLLTGIVLGNPFDQSLNTTDLVGFQSVNFTNNSIAYTPIAIYNTNLFTQSTYNQILSQYSVDNPTNMAAIRFYGALNARWSAVALATDDGTSTPRDVFKVDSDGRYNFSLLINNGVMTLNNSILEIDSRAYITEENFSNWVNASGLILNYTYDDTWINSSIDLMIDNNTIIRDYNFSNWANASGLIINWSGSPSTEFDPLWTANESGKTLYNSTGDASVDWENHILFGTWGMGLSTIATEGWVSGQGYLTSESDPLWLDNSSTVARIGTCAAGQVVQNTTTSGVQCVAAVGDNLGNHIATQNLNITTFNITSSRNTTISTNTSGCVIITGTSSTLAIC